MLLLNYFTEFLNPLGSTYVLIFLGVLCERNQIADGAFMNQITKIVFQIFMPMRLISFYWKLDLDLYGGLFSQLIVLFLLKLFLSIIAGFILTRFIISIPKYFVHTIFAILIIDSFFDNTKFYLNILCVERKDN